MEREELLKSEGYWTAKLQIDLYRELETFMERNKMNCTQLAKHLGCSKSYVSQLLNGNFDHKVSKLVKLAIAIGKAPVIEFKDIESFAAESTTPAIRPCQSPYVHLSEHSQPAR